MQSPAQWWQNGLPVDVKVVFLLLLANGLPALIVLMGQATNTDDLFVWTVTPAINARLIGVMYANALILVAIGVFQTSWPRVRVVMVVITLFSVLATILTLFHLTPFLAHPWYHLAYWLSLYVILFFLAPYVFVTQERRSGGRLPVHVPMNLSARVVLVLFMLVTAALGICLLFAIDAVNEVWPWTLTPLVGGLIGVLFVTHAAAYAWAYWDGDWMRIRPILWQAPLTGLLFLLLPALHPSDLRPDADASRIGYYGLVGLMVAASTTVILSHRTAERRKVSS
ncbi:MAG: hypothetical protein ACR2N6_09665 [Miltoncostaeaceae bacterium]